MLEADSYETSKLKSPPPPPHVPPYQNLHFPPLTQSWLSIHIFWLDAHFMVYVRGHRPASPKPYTPRMTQLVEFLRRAASLNTWNEVNTNDPEVKSQAAVYWITCTPSFLYNPLPQVEPQPNTSAPEMEDGFELILLYLLKKTSISLKFLFQSLSV